jgi:glycosyltransferase involved in cell wall biosynthesis
MDRAARVIAISEFTKSTLEERCGLGPGKGIVVPFGVEDRGPGTEPPGRSHLVEGPYLYYPAATWPHKAHGTLFRAYAALRGRGAIAERLVLTGQRTALWEKTLLPLARELGIERDVVHLGFVPFDEVRRLHAGAAAVLFPSTFEGFGLPVLEAVQAGRKIVTSRLAVFDEIGVPRTAQADFEKPDEVLAALAQPAPTRLLREPLSWLEVARRTVDVLRGASAAGGRP